MIEYCQASARSKMSGINPVGHWSGRRSRRCANGWRADITNGPVFRAIDRWEAIEERALPPPSRST